MDDLPRVKPKQNYEWFQDQKTVRVRLIIKGTSSKKIDIFISDLILKVNVQEKNYVRIFDLQHEIDFKTKENSVVYSNDILEITLKKQKEINWTDFIVTNLDKVQIKSRREDSFKLKEEYDKQFNKQLGDLKIKYDSHATREQMKQEDDMRNELDKRKKTEKEKAEEQIYKDSEKNDQQENGQAKIMYTYKDNEIFTNKDIQNYENLIAEVEERIPKVRNQKKMDIEFTEKIYPMVATREQHFKEAPMPKLKNSKGSKAGEDLENKNPLWLKDKADEFYRNKDFYSAQNAYSQAFKLDGNLITCIANRSALHISLFNYDECISDCDTVLNFAQEGEERKIKYRELIVKAKLRKAIALSWKGLIEESINLFTKTLSEESLEENERAQIQEALNIAQSRNESIKLKKIGDNEYKNANYTKALNYYHKSVDIDGNETSLGNISVTYLKLNKNQECIDACNTCIQNVTQFIRYSNFNPTFKQSSAESNNFLIKLYLRKSKALQNLSLNTEAYDTIKLALQIDETNKEARNIFSSIEKAVNKEKVFKLKQDAVEFMKNKQINNALEIYNECLNILDQGDTLEYLALLLNRCACYLHLSQFDDIISSSLRGLKIIRSFKNRVISWDNQKLSKEDKQKLNDFEVRFLLRRANAYLQQNQIYNAKNDMQEALKIDPTNESIKQDLEKINSSVN